MQSHEQTLAIGIDLGATKIAGALVASDGNVIATVKAPTEANQGVEPVLDRIAGLVNELVGRAAEFRHGHTPGVLGVGIGTPGQVNSDSGVVRNAVNLGWGEVHLAKEIFDRLEGKTPVWIQKDANASVLGEYYFGAGRGCTDFVYLGIGSGLGAGVVANGRLVMGAHWNAAELGHLSLDPHGEICACGQRGCAETVVSGPGLLATVRRLHQQGSFSTGLEVTPKLTSAAIVNSARAGDPLAVAAIAELARWLGIVIGVCAAVTDPQRVILGGGVGLAAFDLIAPFARRELERRVLPATHQELQILPSGQISSAVGAACLAWYFGDMV